MRALVVGGGSIGKRHLENLKALGVDSLALVETDASRRGALAAELSVRDFAHLDDGLAWSPDSVVLATPTHLHAEQALQVARGGFPLFVEKPLSHTPAGLSDLSEQVERKQLISMVGCNLRFHPGPVQVKDLLQQNRIGRVLFARVQTGSYIHSW